MQKASAHDEPVHMHRLPQVKFSLDLVSGILLLTITDKLMILQIEWIQIESISGL